MNSFGTITNDENSPKRWRLTSCITYPGEEVLNDSENAFHYTNGN